MRELANQIAAHFQVPVREVDLWRGEGVSSDVYRERKVESAAEAEQLCEHTPYRVVGVVLCQQTGRIAVALAAGHDQFRHYHPDTGPRTVPAASAEQVAKDAGW